MFLSNLGFNVWIQGVVVDKLEIIATIALPHSSLLQLKPDNFLVVILATTTDHPDKVLLYLIGFEVKFVTSCPEQTVPGWDHFLKVLGLALA